MSKKYKAPGKPAHNRTASGTLASLSSVYYNKLFVQNLKSNTPFLRWKRDCACGNPVASRVKTGKKEITLCDGCKFRHTVMKAAGREEEFLEDYDKKHAAREPIDILKRNSLPASSGKTIQMFKYK
jgi:hypothetical protein